MFIYLFVYCSFNPLELKVLGGTYALDEIISKRKPTPDADLLRTE
jgi:hypothetical protein